MPNKIKSSLDKGKIIDKEYEINKLNSLINECIKIENIVRDINTIDKNKKDLQSIVEQEIVFNLDENDINIFIEKIKKFGEINKQKKIKYNNFRVINKEVKIIEHSKATLHESLDIMIGRKNGDYSLFDDQNGNHFAIFDLNKKLYLKEILISVKQYFGCVLKNFKVSIKDDEGNWIEVNNFCCQDNKNEIDMQKFSIEKETKFVKINFIDAWSKDGGNCILIRRLSFNVADII